MKDKIINLRINGKLKKELQKQAEKENTNLSQLLDRIIRNYLQEMKDTNK